MKNLEVLSRKGWALNHGFILAGSILPSVGLAFGAGPLCRRDSWPDHRWHVVLCRRPLPYIHPCLQEVVAEIGAAICSTILRRYTSFCLLSPA